MAKTAVVILNWNSLGFLKMFLGSVISRTASDHTEVIVADNGSTDGSVDWIQKNHPGIRILRFNENLGFAGGYNRALEETEADYYVLLNSDVEVTEGWLEQITRYLDENPRVASCQPKILSYYNKEYFEHAGAAGGYIDRFGYPFCRGRILSEVEKDTGQYDEQAEVFWSTGACMIVRSDAWKRCGGFDADFFAHMEEIDLCWRFHRLGYKVMCLPQSVVYHVGGGSLPYNSPFKTYLNFRNSLYMLYRNLPDDRLQKTLFTRKLMDGLAAIFFLCCFHGKSFVAVLRAHYHFHRNIIELREKREMLKELTGTISPVPVMNKIIAFEFYIKNNKTFKSLKSKIS